jgi:GT2 family glycosyltransferase
MRVGAIVVHHRSFPDVVNTVEQIVLQGVQPSDVVVVDNSESAEILLDLRSALPRDVLLLDVTNDGYAAAVNTGVRELLGRADPVEAVLVSTHETEPSPGAVDHLVSALRADPSLGVVGPALTNRAQSTQTLWSTGGELVRPTLRARHVGAGQPIRPSTALTVEERDWLDGSFCLYRAQVFREAQLCEEYFLYFEELDFHVELARRGWGVACVTSALVAQSSNGMPAYYYGRNLRLFQKRHGTALSRGLALPEALAVQLRGMLAGHVTRADIQAFCRGWFAWRGFRAVAPRRRS